MATLIISVLLALACIYGVYSYIRKLRYGGGCCGEHEGAVKKVKVADRDKTHYPYETVLTIDGMTCSNCVRRVENALNQLDGVWAQVDLSSRKAAVRMKQPLPEVTSCFRSRTTKRQYPIEAEAGGNAFFFAHKLALTNLCMSVSIRLPMRKPPTMRCIAPFPGQLSRKRR